MPKYRIRAGSNIVDIKVESTFNINSIADPVVDTEVAKELANHLVTELSHQTATTLADEMVYQLMLRVTPLDTLRTLRNHLLQTKNYSIAEVQDMFTRAVQ